MTTLAGPSKRLASIRHAPWWPWTIAGLTTAFVVFIGWLLFNQARAMDWSAVWEAIKRLPTPVLAMAGALAFTSHGLYSTFDLFGRYYTRHGVSVARTIGTTLIAYPFTLNLGSILGGATMRYRLYSRQGVPLASIGQVIGQSILINWLGYSLLAGAVFWLWPPELPDGWSVGQHQLRWVGWAMAGATLAYLVACMLRHGRPLLIRGHAVPVPSLPVGLAQVALSATNWMVMGAAIWMLAQGKAPYAAALATVLLGAVAGLISRIPAGLGVLEAVGVAVLSPHLPAPQALAAILAYRALYFFAPLALATLAFAAVEWRNRKKSRS